MLSNSIPLLNTQFYDILYNVVLLILKMQKIVGLHFITSEKWNTHSLFLGNNENSVISDYSGSTHYTRCLFLSFYETTEMPGLIKSLCREMGKIVY